MSFKTCLFFVPAVQTTPNQWTENQKMRKKKFLNPKATPNPQTRRNRMRTNPRTASGEERPPFAFLVLKQNNHTACWLILYLSFRPNPDEPADQQTLTAESTEVDPAEDTDGKRGQQSAGRADVFWELNVSQTHLGFLHSFVLLFVCPPLWPTWVFRVVHKTWYEHY